MLGLSGGPGAAGSNLQAFFPPPKGVLPNRSFCIETAAIADVVVQYLLYYCVSYDVKLLFNIVDYVK